MQLGATKDSVLQSAIQIIKDYQTAGGIIQNGIALDSTRHPVVSMPKTYVTQSKPKKAYKLDVSMPQMPSVSAPVLHQPQDQLAHGTGLIRHIPAIIPGSAAAMAGMSAAAAAAAATAAPGLVAGAKQYQYPPQPLHYLDHQVVGNHSPPPPPLQQPTLLQDFIPHATKDYQAPTYGQQQLDLHHQHYGLMAPPRAPVQTPHVIPSHGGGGDSHYFHQ